MRPPPDVKTIFNDCIRPKGSPTDSRDRTKYDRLTLGILQMPELPTRSAPPKVMMTWADVLFLHWPVAPEGIRNLVPRDLEIDTFNGNAWVGLVPFLMRDVRTRFGPVPLPAVPFLAPANFPECNVRIYVRHRGRPGCLVSLPRRRINCPCSRGSVDVEVELLLESVLSFAPRRPNRLRPTPADGASPVGACCATRPWRSPLPRTARTHARSVESRRLNGACQARQPRALSR